MNIPASNMEAAWPFMAWLLMSHSITYTVVTSPPRFREGDRDLPLNGRSVKKNCSHVLNSLYSGTGWYVPAAGWGMQRGDIESHCSVFRLCPHPSVFILVVICLLSCQGLSCLVPSVSWCVGQSMGWDLGGFQTFSLVPYPTHSVPDPHHHNTWSPQGLSSPRVLRGKWLASCQYTPLWANLSSTDVSLPFCLLLRIYTILLFDWHFSSTSGEKGD